MTGGRSCTSESGLVVVAVGTIVLLFASTGMYVLTVLDRCMSQATVSRAPRESAPSGCSLAGTLEPKEVSARGMVQVLVVLVDRSIERFDATVRALVLCVFVSDSSCFVISSAFDFSKIIEERA